jgi:hypothetical protein
MIQEHILFRLVPPFKVWFEKNFLILNKIWKSQRVTEDVRKHYGSIWNFAFEVWTEEK